MAKIAYFPVLGTRGEPMKVTRWPVWKIDGAHLLEERLQGNPNRFRLSIDPWDLQRIIAEANRMGREGVEVAGFGYDYDDNAIVMGPKRADKSSPR